MSKLMCCDLCHGTFPSEKMTSYLGGWVACNNCENGGRKK